MLLPQVSLDGLIMYNFILQHSLLTLSPLLTEFNDEQTQVFCVFSGDGVSKLRDYLNTEVLRNARMAEINRERPVHNPTAQHDADGAGDIHMFDDGMGDEDEGMAGMLQNTQLDNDEFD